MTDKTTVLPLGSPSQSTNLLQTWTKADKTGHDDELTLLQERAMLALLTTPTVPDAAKRARVSTRTLRRWLADPVFRRAYLSVRRQALEQETAVIQQRVAKAVAALDRNLACGVASVEVRAAQIVLEQAARSVEMLELEQRLQVLEESLRTNHPLP